MLIAASHKGRTKTMYKFIRVMIAISLVLGIAILARNNAAWAANPAAESDRSSQDQAGLSISPAKDDDCDKDKGKDKEKCKGTVKPPHGIIIPVTGGGTYSVGGICTMTIAYNVSGLSDLLSLEVPVEKSSSVPFPESNGKIHLPGCHVLHYDQSGQLMNEMGPEDGSWTICFAAQPKKTTTIYYYLDNLETVGTTWIPLETTVENGIACASANYSGVYAPASK
jgi:hypothetical protein